MPATIRLLIPLSGAAVPQKLFTEAWGKDLDAAYAEMARDEERESAALEWADATMPDVADAGRGCPS